MLDLHHLDSAKDSKAGMKAWNVLKSPWRGVAGAVGQLRVRYRGSFDRCKAKIKLAISGFKVSVSKSQSGQPVASTD